MPKTIQTICTNIKQLREQKGLSQKQVAAASGIPQGQYSRIENGKVEPAVSTLEKLAAVFEVSLSAFFASPADAEEVNLPLLEKVKLLDSLPKEEKSALFKIIDLALANKRMRDNMQAMIAQ